MYPLTLLLCGGRKSKVGMGATLCSLPPIWKVPSSPLPSFWYCRQPLGSLDLKLHCSDPRL